MLCDGWRWVTTYCAMWQHVPTGFRQSRFEYQMKIVCSRRHFSLNRMKCWNFGHRKPDCPIVIFKNRPLRGGRKIPYLAVQPLERKFAIAALNIERLKPINSYDFALKPSFWNLVYLLYIHKLSTLKSLQISQCRTQSSPVHILVSHYFKSSIFVL